MVNGPEKIWVERQGRLLRTYGLPGAIPATMVTASLDVGNLVLTLAALLAAMLGIFARVSCFLAGLLLYRLAPLETIIWTVSPYARGLTISVLALLVLARRLQPTPLGIVQLALVPERGPDVGAQRGVPAARDDGVEEVEPGAGDHARGLARRHLGDGRQEHVNGWEENRYWQDPDAENVLDHASVLPCPPGQLHCDGDTQGQTCEQHQSTQRAEREFSGNHDGGNIGRRDRGQVTTHPRRDTPDGPRANG